MPGILIPQNDVNFRHPLMRGVVSRWKVITNFIGGKRLVDLCGRYHGTLFNTVQFGNKQNRIGIFNAAENTAYTTQSISIAANTDVSFACWIYPTTFNGTNPGLWRSVSNPGHFNIFSGALYPWIRWNSVEILQPASGYSLPLNQWTYITFVTKSASIAQFYANGILKHSATHSTATAAFTVTDWGTQLTERFQGYFNDMIFWNRGLSEKEVFSLYLNAYSNNDSTLNYNNFAYYYPPYTGATSNNIFRSFIKGLRK